MALTKIRGNTQIVDSTIFDAQIASNAEIATSKLAEGDLFIKSDGSVAFTAPQSGVTPTANAHLTTKEYVDSVATGLDVKVSVRAIAESSVTAVGPQTVDGVSLVAGDRVLLAGQADPAANGIYVVAAGAWARSEDADNSPAGEVTSGMFTFVEEGTAFGGTGWVLTTANPIVLGTTPLVFAQFSQTGVIVAGAGLVKNGNVVDVVSANGGIVANADNIELKVDANATLAITAGGLKLADLPNAKILVGNVSNVATAVSVSGDLSVTNGGVFTIANDVVNTAKILDHAVTLNKLVALDDGKFVVGTGSGNAQVSISGDATVSNTGVLTIANNAVTTAKILDDAVTQSKLADNSVGTLQLIDANVTQTKLASDSVSTAKIVNAAVTLGKLQTLASATIIVGQTGGNAAVSLSGDVTMDEAGVTTVNAATVVKVADVVTRETPAGTLNGVNAVFTLANTPKAGTEHVYYNGLLQDVGGANDYTISGATITFTFAPQSGDKIRVSYFK